MEYSDCANGVRQWDNLSPTLFSILINELATEVKELNKILDSKHLSRHYLIPVLDYCSGSWRFINFSCEDGVQNCAVKFFVGLHRFTPLLAQNGEVGWLPATHRGWMNFFRMWNHLMMMDEDLLTKQAFYWDYNNRGTWSTQVKMFLKN